MRLAKQYNNKIMKNLSEKKPMNYIVAIISFFTRWVGDLGIESNSLEAAVQYEAS